MFRLAQFKIEVPFPCPEGAPGPERQDVNTMKLTEKSMKMQYFFVTKNKQRENEKNELKNCTKRGKFYKKTARGEGRIYVIEKKKKKTIVEAFIYVM